MSIPINFQQTDNYWVCQINEIQALFIKEFDMPPMFIYGIEMLNIVIPFPNE